jgi:carbon monoxide dehydrogenase subunit G
MGYYSSALGSKRLNDHGNLLPCRDHQHSGPIARRPRCRPAAAIGSHAPTMKLTGEITVRAPRETVFTALRDARFFASCVDGVQDLNEIDATHYSAVFETRIAYMKFKFNVTVELTRVEPPSEIEAKVEGVPLGVVGRLTARSIMHVLDAGDETKVRYETESTLAGKLGSIGQPVLRAKAKEMEKQFAKRLQAHFAGPALDAAPESSAPGGAA